MNRFATVALSLLLTGAVAGSALAQSDVSPTNLGSIYVSSQPNTYTPVFQLIPQFAPQSIYIVADIDFTDIGQAGQNVSNGVTAWEGSLQNVPATMSILGVTFNPANAINIGSNVNYIVGTGTAVLASTLPAPLVTLNVIVLGAIPAPGAELTIGAANPATLPGFSVWLENLTVNGCTNRVTNAPTKCLFKWASTGSMRVSTEVAVEEGSWGSLKQGFYR